LGRIRSDVGREIAENLCLGSGCWGKDFFAKVSDSMARRGNTVLV